MRRKLSAPLQIQCICVIPPQTVSRSAKPSYRPKPVPHKMSDQVCESATLCVAMGMLMEFEGVDCSPTHTPATEGELPLASVLKMMSLCQSCPKLVPSSSSSPMSTLVQPSSNSPTFLMIPPSLPPHLQTPANYSVQSLLSPISASAPPPPPPWRGSISGFPASSSSWTKVFPGSAAPIAPPRPRLLPLGSSLPWFPLRP